MCDSGVEKEQHINEVDILASCNFVNMLCWDLHCTSVSSVTKRILILIAEFANVRDFCNLHAAHKEAEGYSEARGSFHYPIYYYDSNSNLF